MNHVDEPNSQQTLSREAGQKASSLSTIKSGRGSKPLMLMPLNPKIAKATIAFIASYGCVLHAGQSKAATAYLFQTPTDYTSFTRAITGTTGSTPDAVWGSFTISDILNPNANTEVAATASGTADIKFYGNPTGGAGSNAYGSTAYTNTNIGTFDRWSYNRGGTGQGGTNTGYLYFWKASGGELSLRLRVDLFTDRGWQKITSADWCANNSANASTTGCSSPNAWSLTYANNSFIRVPSPSLAAGLIPILLFTLRRRSKKQVFTTSNQISLASNKQAAP